MIIAGFLKIRNEILRGNIHRALANLDATCDCGVLCDDASTDGTDEVVRKWILDRNEAAGREVWIYLTVPPAEQDFKRELEVKQQMLAALAALAEKGIDWIWWLDADETLDTTGTREFREWVSTIPGHVVGVRFHYTQLWRNASWARTDDGFDGGYFVKLWRYRPDLSFVRDRATHRQQFPVQIEFQKTAIAPFEIIHWGNYGKALQFKCHQYAGGLGGVDRHLAFGHTPAESLATGQGYDKAEWSKPYPTYRKVDFTTLFTTPNELVDIDESAQPAPFTMDEIRRIRAMGSMRGLPGWFTVVIPAFDREPTLAKALASLIDQRYDRWIAVVLDDGSTDATPYVMKAWQKLDPRIFYCRYASNRGGVAMNEIGMALACEWTEYWSRLGSDDWWGPGKLEADAAALAHHEAVFGPFTVWKHGRADHVSAGSWGPENGARPSERLRRGEFLASWANVAVRTDVLRRVRDRWGCFVHPSLRNMEDFLFNARVAKLGVEWVWRPGDPLDAYWNCLENVGAPATASASANAALTAQDEAVTRKLIAEMRNEP
jgi:glycosyltransferase involved in cell wall biosynthesis